MTYYNPFFLTGLPGISAGASNAIIDASRYVQSQSANIDNAIRPKNDWRVDTWHGLISSSSAISGQTNRWLYQIGKVELTSTPAVFSTNTATHLDLSAYVSPAVTVPAYNLFEYKHTSTGTLGDGTPLTSIPGGWIVQPVVGVVIVYQAIDQEGGVVYVFDRQNGLAGSCA